MFTVLLEGDEKLHSSSSITIRITCGSSGKITSCRSKACREGLAAEAAKKVKVWFQGALDPQKGGSTQASPSLENSGLISTFSFCSPSRKKGHH